MMIYDGFDFKHLLVVENVKRPPLAEIVKDTVTVPGKDGEVVRSVKLGPKTIDVDVRMLAPVPGRKNQRFELSRKRKEIDTHLFRRYPCRLVLDDDESIYEMALLDGASDFENLSYTQATTLSWYCPSPASYGRKRSKSSQGGTMRLNLDGNYQSTPLITIKSSGNCIVYVDDEPFEIEGDAVGEVVIDSQSKRVTCNGRTVARSIMSDWIELHPGNHEFRCSDPFLVECRERWL